MKGKLTSIQILLILFTVSIVSMVYSANPYENEVLLKVIYNETTAKAVKANPDILPVVEMKGYLIGLMERKNVRALTAKKINFTILMNVREEYSYYLVRYASSDTLVKMKTMGVTFELEPGIILFAFKSTAKAPLLPRDTMLRFLPLKRSKLSTPSVSSMQRPILSTRQIPEVTEIISKVSSTIYRNDIVSLQNFKTRYYTTEGCYEAAAYIYNSFSSLGLDAVYQPFRVGDENSRNVVATQLGKSDPHSFIIISGHYDSYNTDIMHAPGADDNASGTSAALEAARILHNYDFDFSIRYIAFDAEEAGLYGSGYYAATAAARQEHIIAVLNLDMIAYVNQEPEDLDLVSNAQSEWLANFVASTTESYTNLDTRIYVDASFQWSDHAPFWQENYSAITGIEDVDVPNPYYHSIGDTVDTLNFPFAVETVKAMLANVILLAQLHDPSLPNPPSDLTYQVVLNQSLFEKRKHIVLNWQSDNDSVLGYNIYRSDRSHSNYSKLNPQPVTVPHFEDLNLPYDSIYYYVVTAVSSTGTESHYSIEISNYL